VSEPTREALAQHDLSANDVDEIIREFLIESTESVDRLDRDLIALERDPASPDLLAGIFRTFHTIKGGCGFLGFGKLEAVTHVAESLLGRLRDGKLRVNPDITSALLATNDAIRALLASIEATRQEGDASPAGLIERLTRLKEGESAAAPVPAPPPAVAHSAAEADARSAAESTIRVDVDVLDKLMNLAGELVLARNQILRHAAGQSDSVFVGAAQRLNRVTTELQERVMKTRMQPVSTVWDKLPRLVRDVARSRGKQVRLEVEGRDTELDRAVIEAIKDPLTHIIRNAIDHGIEAPAERAARHKPAEGVIRLKAFHAGGRVHLEIEDDGNGIDAERVRAKAVERGFVAAEQAARMSAAEAADLVFLPGFSTAPTVTNISGRGVGMDVVRSSIEKIGGTIEMQSRPGAGLTLGIRLPLTLTIIPALIVRTAGQRYAIPQASVLELVRATSAAGELGIESLHDVPVYRRRGTLLPVVHLDRELALEPAAPGANLVVLQTGGPAFGLLVDAIEDSEEIVVKPLGAPLKNLTTFAGATILGDGRVALILDVPGLARRANVLADAAAPRPAAAPAPEDRAAASRPLVLLVAAGSEHLALPLTAVARLEELRASLIERTGGNEVIQYRGEILPVVRLQSARDPDECDRLPAVICAGRQGRICLIVDRILDVVEGPHARGRVVLQDRVTTLLDVDALVPHA
jgi:two-component system chemotaxis sensor kinase CheA